MTNTNQINGSILLKEIDKVHLSAFAHIQYVIC